MIFIAVMLIIPISIFAQDRPPYDEDPVTRNELKALEERLNTVEKSSSGLDPDTLIASVAVSVATAGIVLSYKHSKKSLDQSTLAHGTSEDALKESMKAYDDAKKYSEANFFITIEDKFNEEPIKALMSNVTKNRPLSENNTGYSKGILHKYLSIFDFIYRFEQKGLLSPKYVKELYGEYVKTAWNHQEIQEYIKESREKYGDNMWASFTELHSEVTQK